MGSVKKDQMETLEPKSITSEIKNVLDVINSRLDTMEVKDWWP